jgi:hypothetical protein
MATTSTVERARDIALEVAAYRPDYSEQSEAIARELEGRRSWVNSSEDVRDRNRIIGSLISTALSHSHAVIKQAEQYIAPRGRGAILTRRTLAMTAFAGTPAQPELDAVMDNCCLGAELKFIHGLEYHSLGKRPWSDHEAALILDDVDGEPFAYQKAVGYPYAYVWRSSVMQTHAGPRSLLAGSIIRPIYDRDSSGQSPPEEKFAGAGLARVAGLVADDVEFKRFSLELVPKRIRTAALLDASEPDAYGEYRPHVDEATAMSAAMFAKCIAGLLKNAKNYRAA